MRPAQRWQSGNLESSWTLEGLVELLNPLTLDPAPHLYFLLGITTQFTKSLLIDSMEKQFASRESCVLLTSVIFIESIICLAWALTSSIGYGHDKPC